MRSFNICYYQYCTLKKDFYCVNASDYITIVFWRFFMTQQKNMKSTVNADGFEQINHTFYQLPLQLSSYNMSIAKDSYQPCYFHQEVEFIYILSGSLSLFINGAVCNLVKGEGVFISAARLHAVSSTKGSSCSYVTMIFDSELVRPSFPFKYDVIEQVTNESAPDYVYLSPEHVK